MDITDERRKKLEAGKEKLAAFRKKKAKSKNTVKTDGENLNFNEPIEPVKEDTPSLPDVFATGLTQNAENNDHSHLNNEDDFLPEVSDSKTYHHGIFEPQEAVEGGPLAPEPIIKAAQLSVNEEIPPNVITSNGMSAHDSETFPKYDDAMLNLEKALAQRDKLIEQLTNSLKSNAVQQGEKEELASQVLHLTQHVGQLQTQLEKADHTLREQLQFHGVSTSALESAKTQLLQLQSIVHTKDEELCQASQEMKKNCESLQHGKSENDILQQRLYEKDEELNNLQSCFDAAMSSQLEKQEQQELEKSNQLSEFQSKWREKEDEMKACLNRQAEEIAEWKKSEENWKEKESQLSHDNKELANRLQLEKEERLKTLESELEDLRKHNDESEKEAKDMKKKYDEQNDHHMSCLSKLEALTDEHNQLSFTHSNTIDELESLKSQNSDLNESLRQLTEEHNAIKSELEGLSSKFVEEKEKLESFNNYQAEQESKHTGDCDLLNNRINQLQSSLSDVQKSLAHAENSLMEEKDAVKALQQEVLAKESSLATMSHELSDLSSRNSDLHSQLISKEDQIQGLENVLKEKTNEVTLKTKEVNLEESEKQKHEAKVAQLTKEVNELKDQCEKYTEEIVQQQNSILSDQRVHGVEMSEKEYYNGKMEEQMELMNAELSEAEKKADSLEVELEKRDETLARQSEKCTNLEAQLKLVEEERESLNENIRLLNEEICSLKENLKDEKLKSDIVGEELISANLKLVETENSMQNKLFKMNRSDIEHKTEMELYRSDITKLQKDVEKFSFMSNDLDVQLKSSAQEVEKLNASLMATEECLKLKTKEYDDLKEKDKESDLKINDLESELEKINMEHQEMVGREKETIQNQEEMQHQLESTVSQWQKLQLIVQEKEIELQNLQDDLEEQKRICNTLKNNHEEDLNLVNSDLNNMKKAKENNERRIQELQEMLASVQKTLEGKEAEFLDTITKLQSADSSIQDVTKLLSDKEKELVFNSSEKERISAELSDKLNEIESLKEDLSKAKIETAQLHEEVNNAKVELNNVEASLQEEMKRKESAMEELESKKYQLSEKEREFSSNISNLQAQLDEAQSHSSQLTTETNNVKVLIPQLESACIEKDTLLTQEQTSRKELEILLDNEKQQLKRLLGAMSSLTQDLEMKEEALMANCVLLQEKMAEISEKDSDLEKLHQEIVKAKNDMKVLEENLESTNNDKDSFAKEIESNKDQLDHMSSERNEMTSQIDLLKEKLQETVSDAEKMSTETNELNAQITHLKAIYDEKERLLSEEQEKVKQLTTQMDRERQQHIRLNGLLSSLSDDFSNKEESLVQQKVLLEEKVAELSQIQTELNEKESLIRDMDDCNVKQQAEVRDLTSKENDLESEVVDLRRQVDKHEQDMIELTMANKELTENLTKGEEELKEKEGDLFDLKQDNEIITKECNDLRADIQEKESTNICLSNEIDVINSALQTSHEEKEMLKNNFDACLEEMQQKLSVQECDVNRWKSQLAEETRNRHESQDEMKEIYTQQLAQMEDKLIALEKEKSGIEMKVDEEQTKQKTMKDNHEHQVSELELALQAAQSEAMKLNDIISRMNKDHETELKDLKSVHELQASELMENCLTLEKSMAEHQKNMNEQLESMKQERNEMEQSFENLMSEMDERKRRSDSDISRLNMHQDEMRKDHEKEMQTLEKRYETQMFDLEDRCSIISLELERARKSILGVNGDFTEERRSLENKIEELENMRRELEIKCTILEDDISHMKEQSCVREEEVKSILMKAAEKEDEMKSDLSDLRKKLTTSKAASISTSESLREECESRIEDLNAENKHLKSKLKSLEMNAHLDKEMKYEEGDNETEQLRSRLDEMKKQMTALTDENLSLKRRLLGQKSLEKKTRLLSGVEDICPPPGEPKFEEIILPAETTLLTSTPSKNDFRCEEPFSPTAEEVSLIQGFVSESSEKPLRFQDVGADSLDEEPDFVAEKRDRFQPETVIEKAMDEFDSPVLKASIHPILENVVTEGFQPEVQDQFFMEVTDESFSDWPMKPSVGMSPTFKSTSQFQYSTPEQDKTQQNFVETCDHNINSPPFEKFMNMVQGKEERENANKLEKHIEQIKAELEEQYIFKMRKQQQDITLEYEAKQENMQQEMEQRFAQKEQSVRNDWERKFAKALQKVKKDFERKLQKQHGSNKKQSKSGLTKEAEAVIKQDGDGNEMPNIDEGDEELGDVVEQLSKENQELAEVRDVLLKQIEISQTRGLHNRVQHELQSMLSGRERENATSPQNVPNTSSSVAPVVEECMQTESASLNTGAPGSLDLDADCSRTEFSETSSVAAERLLEEFEDMSQQSSQDLPLEWELTNTIATEVDVSQNEAGHQSIWEVFDSRCLRQDCQELDALRSQYESQLSALQGQLDAERKHNQCSMDASQNCYEQVLSTIREKLDGDQKDLLDELISKLTTIHHGQLQELEDKYKNDVSLEVTAVRMALEQVYMGKAKLEVSAAEAKHEAQLKEMQESMEKDWKEKLNQMKVEQQGIVDPSLTDKYNELIQRISQALDDRVSTDIEASNPSNKTVDGGDSSDKEHHGSQDIRKLLMNQQEEISSLRSQLLGEYESVLQSRTQSMVEQTQEVSDLEEQLKDLQTQYSEQVAQFQAMLTSREDEQKKLSEEERNKFEEQQAELKSHYEKRVQDIEASFEKEINCMKDRYEQQISGLIHERLGSISSNTDLGNDDLTDQSPRTDTDSDNANTPRSTAADTAYRIKELEKELEERDSQIQELKTCLDYNDNDAAEFKKRVEGLESELSDAKAMCSKLEEIVEENKHVIETLEQEKKESEKLYKDLLEKESPRSKGSAVREYVSSDSVDDSFSSAREEIQDTPRSLGSPVPEAVSSGQKNTKEDSNQLVSNDEDKEDEHNNTIPFANDSTEYADNNTINSNRNNNNDSNSNDNNNSTLSPRHPSEEQVSNLKDQLEELSDQLEEARTAGKKLLSQIDESQHKHQEMMEDLRQELEHEKQIEVETLQSEFQVQMDIELKRQAAELALAAKATQVTSCQTEQQTETLHSDVDVSGKLYSTLETAEDSILEASNSNLFLQTANFELQTVVMASPQLTEGEDRVVENLSDDSKVTSALSPLSSPTHTTATVASVTQSLPLTDMEKEVQAMRDEYETKMTHLSSEIERLNEEKKTSAITHQQRVEELENQINEAEARYDRLMEGVESGDHPELNDLMKDKYDQELDLAKSLMQKDFDEMMTTEKKKFMEHHRKLMSDFMEDKGTEDEESQKKHDQELEDLRERLNSDFETRIQGYEQEIERLNRDLDLLRGTTPRGSDEGTQDSTLREIGEITLPLQSPDVESESPGEKSSETSPQLKSPGLSYEESEEEETDAEKHPTLQIRSFPDAVKAPSPSPYLLKEKEELEMKVQQLVAQVERLTQQLAERQNSSPVSPLHSPHNTTLKAEDPALISMLQSDLDRISAERETVQNTNDRLLSLLSDTVKTYIGVEDTINRKLTQVVSGTPRSQSQGDSGDASRAGSVELGMKHGGESQGSRQGSPSADVLKGASPDVDTSHDSHAMDNTSILSNATDEGLEISQRLAESIFVGPDLDEEGEEILSDARGRLTSAVGQLLALMEQSTIQLHEAKNTQEELLATLATRTREVDASQSRGFELNSQLATEIEAKEYLGLELHKAEGLIAGYVAERESNEKQIQALEEQREALIVELDSTRSRLEDFQRSQSEIESTREELTHQQALLRENVGQETQEGNGEMKLESPDSAPALLNEVSNLNQERRELATQLQHQLDLSRKRLSEMEALAEEAERKHESVVEEKNRCLDDMHLQLDNTERQLKSSKAFVDELLVEREQEREEHQKEIEKMKETIEGKDRSANSHQRMQREIADLTEQLQARIATQTTMHQRIVDLQKVLEDKELSANDLKVWVSQLEGELDQKFSVEDQLKERISKLERQLTEKSESNGEEVETDIRIVLSPRCEGGTEESDDEPTTKKAPRLPAVSLEEELQKSKETKEELDQENNTLKQQLHDQMLQISGLKNQVDQMRHYAAADDSDAAQLRERLAQERDQMEKRETELADAERKIEHLESLLQTKQLEADDMSSKVNRILEMGEAQEENERLKNELLELKSQLSDMSSSSHQLSMPASLLEEKNEEISELKTRLQIVEAEREQKIEQTTEHQENVLHLQQQLKERDEEIVDLQDSLASARRGEACLDMSLPLTDEAGSMLNISMTGRTSIQQEFEETIAQREGEVNSLEQEVTMLKKELEQKNDELKEIQAKMQEKNEDDEKMKSELAEKEEEIQKLQYELLASAKEIDELKSSVENLQMEKQNLSDQEKVVESLENTIQEKDNEIYQLTLEIQELKTQVEEAAQAAESMEKILEEKEAELTQVQEERDEKRDQLQEKEHKLDQMVIQIDGLQAEISGLTTFQTELQKDFDTIQSMLDEKEKELETLTQELTDTKSQQDVLDSMMQLERMVASLQNDLEEKQNVVEEKEEELYELRDKIEDMGNVKEELDSANVELKKALDSLETEKQTCSDLKKLLTKENEDAETVREKLNLAEENLKVAENEKELTKEMISNLEQALKENGEKANHEIKLLMTECDKIKLECDSKVKDFEEQLQMQEANNLAIHLASGNDTSQIQELESYKLQSEEKDAMLEDLNREIKELESNKDMSIDSLKEQLENQSKDVVNLKRQLQEMDEQLRSRQSVLLELQSENEKLSNQSTDTNNEDGLSEKLEEKDQQVNELEGQLRFRQCALLEMEAEKENLIEENSKKEQMLKKELEEKENALQELQMKYINLKDGINEEVLHMEQEMLKSSQATVSKKSPKSEKKDTKEVRKLQQTLLQKSEESARMKNRLEDMETEIFRKNNELEVRANTIHELLKEVESLQPERSLLESKDMELEKLQSMIIEAQERASLEAANVEKLRKELAEKEPTQLKEGNEVCEEEFISSQTTASLMSIPLASIRSDTSVEERESSSQISLLTEYQQQMDELQKDVQEKEKNIKELTNEIESLKSQIEEQDRVILSLKDELDISGASHQEQLLSRDNQISELQERIRELKPQSSLIKVQISEENALSPQTKEQISQLKSQLRKAHAALEEMQLNGAQKMRDTYEDDVDSAKPIHQGELEALRKIVQEQEEELVMLKSQIDEIQAEPVKEESVQAEKAAVTKSQQGKTEEPKSHLESNRGYIMEDISFGSTASNSDNVPPRIQALLDRLHDLGEDLLSASDFEYLQRHLFPSSEEDSSSDTSAWSRERAALMDTIVAVKDLLQQADRLASKSVEELTGSGDWRGDLLDSLIQVYQSERHVLRAEVGTADAKFPEMDIITELESRIHDLEQVHQRGLDEMLKVDRQSLLDEVDNLHHRLLEAKAQLQDTRHTLDQRIAALEEAKSKAEWKLQRQIQMLEYKIQQEGVIQEDLKKSLNLERQRVSELSSQSSFERSKTLELQSELSSTQIQLSKVRDALEREQHRFNSVTDALEEEQAKTIHLSDLLDSTKKKLNNIKEEVAHSEARHQQASDSESVYLKELRIELDKEREKSYEYSRAEEYAQNHLVQLTEKLDNVKKKLNATKEDYEAQIEQLHREWMERDVMERRERESETVTKLTDLLDVERDSHQTALDNERQVARKLKDALEEIKSENDRILHLYEVEKSCADKLKRDLDNNRGSNDMLRHLRNTEAETRELQQKVLELEEELSHVQERAAVLEAELNRSRENGVTNGHVVATDPGDYHRDAISSLMTATIVDEELKVRLAQCCTRLQMIASKLQDMTGEAIQNPNNREGGDVDGDGDESRGLKVVMEELEKLKTNIREREEKRQNIMEKDRMLHSDQLLQHNKQLAEHVKKLKMEKDELTDALKKMEDKKFKMSLPQYTSDVTSDEEGVYDRTVWASEKLSLQMALDSAEHEIQRLRTELRRFSSLTKADGQLMKLDPDKTQRLYGKYLRAESFRKALIYQKKYLLLLLGGYRDTEQETLAILASMGGFPSQRTGINHPPAGTRPISTFRSAGRAVISIFRMRYLVRKWKRATRVGSPVMTGQITTLHAYIPNPSSSYPLPQNLQQQQSQPHQQQQQPQPQQSNQSRFNHHRPNSSSPSSSPRTAVGVNSKTSSDYVESLTNGGLSSLTHSNSGNSNHATAASSSHHPHQVPSHHQRPLSKYNTTPPTKDSSKHQHNHKAARGDRASARRQILQEAITDSDSPASRSQARSATDSDDENFIKYLENVQQQLSEGPSSSRRVSWR